MSQHGFERGAHAPQHGGAGPSDRDWGSTLESNVALKVTESRREPVQGKVAVVNKGLGDPDDWLGRKLRSTLHDAGHQPEPIRACRPPVEWGDAQQSAKQYILF